MLVVLSMVGGVCLWVNNSVGERDCTSYLSQERWSYCAAVTFGPAPHGILQLLPLSCGTTMDDCSWMQRRNPLKFCTSLSCLRRKNKKGFQSTPCWNMDMIGINMFAKVLREILTKPPTTRWKSSHQTTLSASLKKLKLCVDKFFI